MISVGSSSGIGEDAVIEFAKLGAQVVITGRNEERVAAVAKKCNEVSPKKVDLKVCQIIY